MTTEDDRKARYYRTFYEVVRTARTRQVRTPGTNKFISVFLPTRGTLEYTRLETTYVEARMQQEEYGISIKTNGYLAEFLFKELKKIEAVNLIERLVLGKPFSEK